MVLRSSTSNSGHSSKMVAGRILPTKSIFLILELGASFASIGSSSSLSRKICHSSSRGVKLKSSISDFRQFGMCTSLPFSPSATSKRGCFQVEEVYSWPIKERIQFLGWHSSGDVIEERGRAVARNSWTTLSLPECWSVTLTCTCSGTL